MSPRIAAAYIRPNPVQPTGGDRYNQRLLEAWEQRAGAEIRYLNVRMRWIHTRMHGAAWLIQHRRALEGIDAVLQPATHIFATPQLIWLARRWFPRLRHIGVVHHPRWLEDPALQGRERDFFNRFDAILTISEHVRATLRRAGVRVPMHVLLPGRALTPPGEVPVEMSPSRLTAAGAHDDSSSPSPPFILWNGYLLARKGPLTLLRALERLRTERWHARFVVASEPSPEFSQRFRDALEALPPSVRERIEVSPRLPIEEFRALMRRTDVFCLPSLVEGYSIATAEAMAAGCAVVVPRTENFVELLGQLDYGGFYDLPGADTRADDEDAAPLTERLEQLLADDAQRAALAAYGTRRAAQLPDWDDFAVGACRLLPGLLAGHRDPTVPGADVAAIATQQP